VVRALERDDGGLGLRAEDTVDGELRAAGVQQVAVASPAASATVPAVFLVVIVDTPPWESLMGAPVPPRIVKK
jgi:hypothetical protein